MKLKARQLGIPFPGEPGQWNAITDVPGVEVGHCTILQGEGPLIVGKGPVRTGVTAILPRGKQFSPVMGGWFTLNGCGEMTGTTWLEESGFVYGPIMLTNTGSVGMVHQCVNDWQFQNQIYDTVENAITAFLPVVTETCDGHMNDILGFHVKKEHVFAALDQAANGPMDEGCVGGGTGMMCYDFKGGIGTSSRKVTIKENEFTIGVLVQANHGSRHQLLVSGAPVGQEITDLMPDIKMVVHQGSSIVMIVATDIPLLPHQLKRLAKRAALGMARTGGIGENGSGDIMLAFSTANQGAADPGRPPVLTMLPNEEMNPIFEATAYAAEEAIINAMTAAETMTGINGNTVHALPHDRLVSALKKYNRIKEN